MKKNKNKSLILDNARIGIWGFGVTGKAAAAHFLQRGYSVSIMEKRRLTEQEMIYVSEHSMTMYPQEKMDHFFTSCDYLFSSPGINIENYYATCKSKYMCELDYFQSLCKKPIIAVTGSVGKTSVTSLLSHIFAAAGIHVGVGGNIGTSTTFDLLEKANSYEKILLEVSSFQLIHCLRFAPQLAIWTNFHPNHLDYHTDEHDYFLAKNKIMAQQIHNQQALVPLQLYNRIRKGMQKCSYFTATPLTKKDCALLQSHENLYAIENQMIIRLSAGTTIPLIPLCLLPDISFIDNFVIIVGACDMLGIDLSLLPSALSSALLPEHRLEKIEASYPVDFYNDSKSTTTISTGAAVEKYKNRTLHLFLGGLSKGVDRTEFIYTLKNKVKCIYCFGAEAESLYAICIKYGICAEKCSTLPDAFAVCVGKIQVGDCVLFSPAGSSFDLYNNYQERGNHFKKLVHNYIKSNNI